MTSRFTYYVCLVGRRNLDSCFLPSTLVPIIQLQATLLLGPFCVATGEVVGQTTDPTGVTEGRGVRTADGRETPAREPWLKGSQMEPGCFGSAKVGDVQGGFFGGPERRTPLVIRSPWTRSFRISFFNTALFA